MRTLARLRSECDRRLGGIPVPQPFNLAAFTTTLARHRHRELRLAPLPATPATAALSGFWIATGTADYVLVDAHASPWHRDLIALHEIGHILYGHSSDATLAPAAALLPGLSPDAIRRALGRHGYTTREEREAETIASLILERAGSDPLPVTLPGCAGATARLAHALRHPVRRAR